jgi:hypothetical protein
MPWLSQLLELMKNLKPDDGHISKVTGLGARHVDLPQLKSALNYIFDNEDDSAYTSVFDNQEVFTYPSTTSSAWILNSQIPHQVVNNGIRWTLSIHFGVEYEVVSNWFYQNSNLTFPR